MIKQKWEEKERTLRNEEFQKYGNFLGAERNDLKR